MDSRSPANIGSSYKDKVILVTGGAGSIGSELVKKTIGLSPRVVRAFDNNETDLFNLEQELRSERLRTFVGDVRDRERLKRAFEDVNIVFHAAALKHVPSCEYNPFEAVKTNVIGTQNVIDAALDEEVEKMILVTTDKAVNPANVMGATKLLAERLTLSANNYKGKRKTAFSCARCGNVLNSKGSVVQVFLKQIREGDYVTITDPAMTRFVMSIPRVVELILEAAENARGGEIFVLKMPALKVIDLAQTMIEWLAPKYGHRPEEIQVRIVGKRPGEKTHEALMSEDEAEYAVEKKGIYIIDPKRNSQQERKLNNEYVSSFAERLSTHEIKELLTEMCLL